MVMHPDRTWSDLWLNKDQQAQRELEAGNATDAAALFKNRDWQAVADYEAGDYAGSASVFSENDDSRNLYNLGNAMAFQGDFDAAIDAYEQVLEKQPDNEDAAYNLDLVTKKKEQQVAVAEAAPGGISAPAKILSRCRVRYAPSKRPERDRAPCVFDRYQSRTTSSG